MQLCVLKFEGSHAAEDALNEVIDAEGVRNPWLLEVGAVERPLLGRVRIGVTFPDGKSTTFHEGGRDATEELHRRLEALHSRMAQSLSHVGAEAAPATH